MTCSTAQLIIPFQTGTLLPLSRSGLSVLSHEDSFSILESVDPSPLVESAISPFNELEKYKIDKAYHSKTP